MIEAPRKTPRIDLVKWMRELRFCEAIAKGEKSRSAILTLPWRRSLECFGYPWTPDGDHLTKLYSLRAHMRGRLHAKVEKRYCENAGRHVSFPRTMADQERLIAEVVTDFAIE